MFIIRKWLCLLFFAASASAGAASFPSKPVKIVIPYGAGGPVDTLLRAVAQVLTAQWGQPVLIDNRPGASEFIAAQLVANAEPDGHTLLASTDGGLVNNLYLYSRLPYDPVRDFAPVTRLMVARMGLVTRTSSPVNSFSDFVTATKRPSRMSYGSGGVGSSNHIPMEVLKTRLAIDLVHVPYKGVPPMLQDVASGNVDFALVAIAGYRPFVEAGKLKVLAISGRERSPSARNVPTFVEEGLADYMAEFWAGLVAPARTPPAVIKKIADDVQRVLHTPEFDAKVSLPNGFEVVADNPRLFSEFLKRERLAAEAHIRISGAKLD